MSELHNQLTLDYFCIFFLNLEQTVDPEEEIKEEQRMLAVPCGKIFSFFPLTISSVLCVQIQILCGHVSITAMFLLNMFIFP